MPEDAAAQIQHLARSFKRRLTRTVSGEYLLFLPNEYGPQSSRRWPLILFLHGAGERGTNVWTVAKHGPWKIAKTDPSFPFIIVAPQCLPGQFWSHDGLLGLLDNVSAKYAVDAARIYLTGVSMGGYGAWSLALAHPERFAAVAPICGGGSLVAMVLQDRNQVRALRTLGVWAFHGAKDSVIPWEESARMVNALKQIGNEARFTLYPDADHDCWTETYNNPALYEWFLQYRRRKKPVATSGPPSKTP